LVRLHPWSDEEVPETIAVREPVTVGRDEACGVAFREESVSRKHATVDLRGLYLGITDLGSRNGTFVEEQRVEGTGLAKPGDVVRFGRCVFVVVPDVDRYRGWWNAETESGPEARDPKPETRTPVVGGPALAEIRELVRRFGPLDGAVLISGETGTGKELVAREVHRASGRGGPLVAVNCAAVPEQLFEAQFFGHRRGAFTGADRDEPGYFRSANGGTIFLDEVGELAASLQAKLLRVLETRHVVPVGSTKPEPIDVRIVSATNRDLAADVAAGRFRQDLYSRLLGLTIALPPLRERRPDVALLARHFLRGSPGRGLAFDALVALVRYPWPGNVRELHHAVAEADAKAAADGSAAIELRHLRADVARAQAAGTAGAEQDERTQAVLAALREHRGNVAHAAEALGLHRAQIYTVLRRIGRKAEEFR
jgi:transcriptional regulator with PAS, ATPase and Fis domain